MLISLSYYLGDNSKNKYFDNFEEMKEFIKHYLEVQQKEYNSLEMTIYTGKEEERVRKINVKIKGEDLA